MIYCFTWRDNKSTQLAYYTLIKPQKNNITNPSQTKKKCCVRSNQHLNVGSIHLIDHLHGPEQTNATAYILPQTVCEFLSWPQGATGASLVFHHCSTFLISVNLKLPSCSSQVSIPSTSCSQGDSSICTLTGGAPPPPSPSSRPTPPLSAATHSSTIPSSLCHLYVCRCSQGRQLATHIN